MKPIKQLIVEAVLDEGVTPQQAIRDAASSISSFKMKEWNGPITVKANGREQKFLVRQDKLAASGKAKPVLYLAQIVGSKGTIYKLDSKDNLTHHATTDAVFDEIKAIWDK